MPPLLVALLCSAAAIALHMPLAAGQVGPGDIVVTNYNGGVQSADTLVTVYDGTTGAVKFTVGPFLAPAGLIVNAAGCVFVECKRTYRNGLKRQAAIVRAGQAPFHYAPPSVMPTYV